ncbi:type II toxin-antitoxin system mRNA interferase toxin, RelE/StbE family [Candidatus Gottesmanbacteria bacterium]|nr:type II toxin-antitoxin system mRNA interferase toxin, RelE/StbE family [Candidatus Gottesmanbacteria bacterium]
MKIELTKTALKQLSKLPRSEAKKIDRKLHELENNPFSAKKLEGKLKDRYVIRAWPYRIIYVIVGNVKIQIETIEHRQGVYK